MKTSVKALLNFRADNRQRHSLVIQVIHGRRRSLLFSEYRLLFSEFDTARQIAVPTNRSPSCRRFVCEVNGYIADAKKELLRIVDSFRKQNTSYTARDITDVYRRRCDNRYIETFGRRVVDELNEAGHFGTARTYRSLLSAWEKFTGGERCAFSRIDHDMLLAFQEHLEYGNNRRNTVTFYLRTLRALYHRARRRGYAPKEGNPFLGISFRPARTGKLAVSQSLLQTLSCTTFNRAELNEARDVFMCSFYARGMSFVDLAYLRKSDIRDGILHYKRKKVDEPMAVRIIPKLKAILSRYDDPLSPWVLPCMSRGLRLIGHPQEVQDGKCAPALLYKAYTRALKYYLDLLGEVSRELECRKLTFNVARHSWATLAQQLGVPVSHIGKGLGHTSERTTRCYLDSLDNRIVDSINRRVSNLL